MNLFLFLKATETGKKEVKTKVVGKNGDSVA